MENRPRVRLAIAMIANATVANAILVSGALVAFVAPTRANAQSPAANRATLLAGDRAAPRRVSYLTVWKRNSVSDPWKLAIE